MAIIPRMSPRGSPFGVDVPDAGNLRQLRRGGLGMLVLLLLASIFYQVPALASNRLACELFSWLFVVGALTAYWRGYIAMKTSSGQGGERQVIVGFALAFGLVSLVIPPFHSTDLFCYINRGWQQVAYDLNPYVHPLVNTPNWQLDPMFRAHWIKDVSPYGFLFEWLARGICQIGNGNWLATLLLFKLVCLVVYALTAWTVWKGCRRLGFANPERVVYLFLWNPVLIVHSLVNGHNDLWMGLLASAGVLSTVMGGWLWATPMLTAATLIKYASAALLPFTVLYLGRRVGWRRSLAGVGFAGIVFAVLAWPYIGGDRRLLMPVPNVANARVHNSPAALVLFLFEQCAGPFPALKLHLVEVTGAIKAVFWAVFLVFYSALAWNRFRSGPYDRASYLRDCVLIQFALICIASPKYYAWYLGMFYPLALWLPEGDRLRRVILAVTSAQLLSLTFVAQAHFLNVVLMLVVPMTWALMSGKGKSSVGWVLAQRCLGR